MPSKPLTLSCRDRTHTVAEWARISGTPGHTILARVRRGWPIEEAIFTPPMKRGAYRESLNKIVKGCRGCYHYKPYYWGENLQRWYCDYIGDTGHKRPCPPGPGCTCYTTEIPKHKLRKDFEE